MIQFNYHHLYYFYMVVREGTVSKAAQTLRVGQPTVSSQVKQFEEVMEISLFERRGRKLILTEDGKRVFAYAERIFSTGQEMMDSFRGNSSDKALPTIIGVSPSVPLSFVDSFLDFVLNLSFDRQISVREKPIEQLLQELWVQKLDFVVTDLLPHIAMGPDLSSRLIDRVPVSFVAHPSLAARFPGRFPERLNGAPLILPTSNRILCAEIREYLSSRRIRPAAFIEVDNIELAYRMVAARRGIAPLNEHTAKQNPSHKLVFMNDEPTGFYRSSHLIWRSGKKDHPVLAAVLEKFKLVR